MAFTEKVIKVFKKSDRFTWRSVIWGSASPMFAKQAVFTTTTEEERIGKIKGLTLEDLEWVEENMEAIKESLRGE